MHGVSVSLNQGRGEGAIQALSLSGDEVLGSLCGHGARVLTSHLRGSECGRFARLILLLGLAREDV